MKTLRIPEQSVVDLASTAAAADALRPKPSMIEAFAGRFGSYLRRRKAKREARKAVPTPGSYDLPTLLSLYEDAAVNALGLEVRLPRSVGPDPMDVPADSLTTPPSTTNAPPTQKASAAALYDISDEYTRAEARDIARAVLAGYNNDKSSAAVSKVLQKQLGLPAAQADVVATTELTRVAAADQLSDARIAADESGKKARVRFITGVGSCPICTALHGKVYNLEDAQDVIPVHPNCTCRWQALGDPALNVFCPTGEGGGVDPTCSSGGKGGGKVGGKVGWAKRLAESDPEAARALRYYTGEGYARVNFHLRNKTTRRRDDGDGSDEEWDDLFKSIDRALEAGPKHEGKVYRGLSFDSNRELDAFVARARETGVVTDPAYASSSTSEGRAAKHSHSGGVMMRIQSKTGVDVKDASREGYEDEVLFPRDTKFKVLSITMDGERTVMDLEEE